jgi:hypothetical protein
MKKFWSLMLTALCVFARLEADGREIPGSGPPALRPGLNKEIPRILHGDVARSKPGDYFWREIDKEKHTWLRDRETYQDPVTGKDWGWLVVYQGDINYSIDKIRQEGGGGITEGYQPGLSDISESGEVFTEYTKTDGRRRRVFKSGIIEDILISQRPFNEALEYYKKIYSYSVPIPRRNASITGATNWYYQDTVPRNFPSDFWASITLEGRIMKVIIANGQGHRIAVSYWAQPEFMEQYPNASWVWKGKDSPHSRDALGIQEDPSTTLQAEWGYAD